VIVKTRSDPPAGRVRRQLADLGHRPRRALGQHFLADPGIAARIVDLADIPPGSCVVEIGPGLGALTDLLAEKAGKLILIEYDRDLARDLRSKFAGAAHVTVVEGDALEVDFGDVLGATTEAIVVANLPYNIATAVLARLLDQRGRFARLVVMIQREVAERLRATPGSKAYGALSVLTQAAARVQRGFRVAPGAFVPRPEVDSEVVRIEPSREWRADIADFDAFRRLVQTVFGQRRKQLGNSLRPLAARPAELLRAAGLDPMRRAETLSLEEFARLSNAFSCQLSVIGYQETPESS
jgi:16S rRNA (adenine1518-N6/adenine1519-N6)-dimethyltransferase